MIDVPVEIDDVVVLLLGAPGADAGRIEGITRLEKLVFLFEHESALSGMMTESGDYRPYHYGPFSEKVYQAVSVLAAAGLVTERSTSTETDSDSREASEVIGEGSGDKYASRDFSLTDDGWSYYRSLIGDLPPEAEELLAALKAQFGSIPLRRLLRYVYQQYPEFTTESVIRDDVLAG